MNAYFYFLIVVIVIFTLIVLFFAIKSHKFFKTLIFNAFLGICTLSIIDLTSRFTGIYIPLNPFTVSGSGIFGIPFVGLFLLLNSVIF